MNKKNTPKNTKAKKADKISDVKNELKESKEKYLRIYSEFENYRRRTSKEKLEMIVVSNQELIKDILPVIDDFKTGIMKNSDIIAYLSIDQAPFGLLQYQNWDGGIFIS